MSKVRIELYMISQLGQLEKEIKKQGRLLNPQQEDSIISNSNSQKLILAQNRGIADLVSTSQDDLDNYVYEDQESGTHVLDDDIDGNDFKNIQR